MNSYINLRRLNCAVRGKTPASKQWQIKTHLLIMKQGPRAWLMVIFASCSRVSRCEHLHISTPLLLPCKWGESAIGRKEGLQSTWSGGGKWCKLMRRWCYPPPPHTSNHCVYNHTHAHTHTQRSFGAWQLHVGAIFKKRTTFRHAASQDESIYCTTLRDSRFQGHNG